MIEDVYGGNENLKEQAAQHLMAVRASATAYFATEVCELRLLKAAMEALTLFDRSTYLLMLTLYCTEYSSMESWKWVEEKAFEFAESLKMCTISVREHEREDLSFGLFRVIDTYFLDEMDLFLVLEDQSDKDAEPMDVAYEDLVGRMPEVSKPLVLLGRPTKHVIV